MPPLHWDWDWSFGHHDHFWHTTRLWPWKSYHLKCPTRRHFWSSGDMDLDAFFCDDSNFFHSDNSWCHRSCLVSKVYIETGNESDTNGKGTFKAVIDVHHFHPEELKLKVKNNDTVILEGKQKDDRSDKGVMCIMREFTRKYKLPRNYDATLARASLSSDGILTIMVPAPPLVDDVERVVDIVQTGKYFGTVGPKDTKAIKDAEDEGQEKATKRVRTTTEDEDK